MKKFLIGLGLLALLLPSLAVGLFWNLASTPAGTQWLAGQLARLSGDALAWQQLEGTLLQSLRLRGLRLRLPGIAVDIDAFSLEWQPELFARTLRVIRLEAGGIRLAVTDSGNANSPGQPFNPADLALPIALVLETLELNDIEVRIRERPPRFIDTITLAARLQDHQLALQQLRVHAAAGEMVASGTIELSDVMPLGLDVQWDWRLPDQRWLGGHLLVAGDANTLGFEQQGRGDVPVNLRGKLLRILGQPSWELAVTWPEMAVATERPGLLAGPGEIRTRGNLDDYQVAGEGRLVAPGLDAVRWSLSVRGAVAGIHLEQLTLTSGPYELALSGDVLWNGSPAADLSYRARAEQLAALNPLLPPRLDATGALVARFEGETLTLEHLSLALEQAPLGVTLQGSAILPAAGEPIVDMELHWRSLQWPLVADAAVSSPRGRVVLAGSPSLWNVELALQVAGSNVPGGEWLGKGEGDGSELRLQTLHGALLDGDVYLDGVLGWDPVPRWNLQVRGKGLNPGKWQPGIPGRFAFEMHSEGRVESERGPQATLALRQASGEISGRHFSLSGNAAVAGDLVQFESLVLASGENRFSASGQLDGRRLALEWALRAPDPGLLLPGAAGSLEGAGQIGGSPADLSLQARLSGHEIRFDDLYLPRLAAGLQAGLAAQAPLQLDIELGRLQQGERTVLDSARLYATGTTASHHLDLDLQGLSERVQLRLAGGLDAAQRVWHGQLASLAVNSEALGNWQLAQAAALLVAPQRAALDAACLQSGARNGGTGADATLARLCAGGEWDPLTGARVQASLQDFALARLLPGLTGELKGEVHGALAPGGTLAGRARLDISPGEMLVESSGGMQRLVHGGGQLDVTIAPTGLDASLGFRPLQNGQIQARLTLPQFNSLPLAASQPLSGRIQAELPDLGGLQGWVPALEAVAGRLDSDLRLTGDLRQPYLEGELALTQGAADIPVAGLQLREVQLRLQDDPAEPSLMRLTGGLQSGQGKLQLDGKLARSGDMLALALTGEGVEVFATPDARVLVSPDLDMVWADELLRLRGRVLVPQASITPQLGVRSGSASREAGSGSTGEAQSEPGKIIAPSVDVVVLGREDAQLAPGGATLPFRFDSQVELVLGDKVRVAALGFSGDIVGGVTFFNPPQQSALIPIADGRLSVVGGEFRAFGQDLNIETGEVIFRKVPVTEPEVNLRAVRWIDNDPLVTAVGVEVSGLVAAPELELFSRPQLTPTEIQSYLLTGRSTSSRDSVLSVGTYLYPKLYVGYGHNLLEQTSEFDAIYTITPRYGIESSVGAADSAIGVGFTYER